MPTAIIPSQQALTDAWNNTRHVAHPLDGATVVSLDQDGPAGHSWTFFLNADFIGDFITGVKPAPDPATVNGKVIWLDAGASGAAFWQSDGVGWQPYTVDPNPLNPTTGWYWLDRGTDTVNQATFESLGIVKGTPIGTGQMPINGDGQPVVLPPPDPAVGNVKVNLDGSLTVWGFDSLVGLVASALQRNKTAETNITNLGNNKQDKLLENVGMPSILCAGKDSTLGAQPIRIRRASVLKAPIGAINPPANDRYVPTGIIGTDDTNSSTEGGRTAWYDLNNKQNTLTAGNTKQVMQPPLTAGANPVYVTPGMVRIPSAQAGIFASYPRDNAADPVAKRKAVFDLIDSGMTAHGVADVTYAPLIRVIGPVAEVQCTKWGNNVKVTLSGVSADATTVYPCSAVIINYNANGQFITGNESMVPAIRQASVEGAAFAPVCEFQQTATELTNWNIFNENTPPTTCGRIHNNIILITVTVTVKSGLNIAQGWAQVGRLVLPAPYQFQHVNHMTVLGVTSSLGSSIPSGNPFVPNVWVRGGTTSLDFCMACTNPSQEPFTTTQGSSLIVQNTARGLLLGLFVPLRIYW